MAFLPAALLLHKSHKCVTQPNRLLPQLLLVGFQHEINTHLRMLKSLDSHKAWLAASHAAYWSES